MSTGRIVLMLIGLMGFGVLILGTLPGVQNGDKTAQSILVFLIAFCIIILLGLGKELMKRSG